MPAINPGAPVACKPVLNAPPEVIAGYRTFHIQEAKYTGIALEKMPAEIAVWHRYLTLFGRTMRREHKSPSDNQDDARTAWGLRLGLASAAAASAKLTLDAALAGYYSQSYALIRHMLESWQQMAYVRLSERAAQLWFSPDGVREPRQPNSHTSKPLSLCQQAKGAAQVLGLLGLAGARGAPEVDEHCRMTAASVDAGWTGL